MADYLRRLGLTIACGLLLALALVVIVDPYRLYGFGPYGFNAIKPRPDRYQSEIKLSGARRLHSNALILGNSRAEIGFDPVHPAFGRRNLNAYNLAVPGTSIIESARQLAYLLRDGQKPKVVVIGVEFLDFLVAPERRDRLPDIHRHSVEDWRWKSNALFSLHSVGDAWRTLQIQDDPYAETVTERGFNPLLEYGRMAKQEGYYALFAQRAQENAKSFAKKPRAIRHETDGISPEIEALREIYRLAAEHGIEMNVIIFPYHAQIMLMFENFGLLPLFEEWKAMLASEAQSSGSIRIWDFSGYAGPRCEKIPARDDRSTQTRWYWEGGHFKAELGNLVLDEILADRQSLGFKLDASSLEANRQRLRREKTQCRSEYPELFSGRQGVVWVS